MYLFYNMVFVIVEKVSLPQGNYCIIPCTYEQGQEADLLLRVFHGKAWKCDLEFEKRIPFTQLRTCNPQRVKAFGKGNVEEDSSPYPIHFFTHPSILY